MKKERMAFFEHWLQGRELLTKQAIEAQVTIAYVIGDKLVNFKASYSLGLSTPQPHQRSQTHGQNTTAD